MGENSLFEIQEPQRHYRWQEAVAWDRNSCMKISLSTLERKVAALLFRNGFRLGYALLYADMVQSALFIRQRTSTTFQQICQEIVLTSAWNNRRQFRSHEDIQNYTLRWSILLTERELDRQRFLTKMLVFTCDKHNPGFYRLKPIPDFIVLLVRKYDVQEITNQVHIPSRFVIRLMRDSFERIKAKRKDSSEFIALWDELTAAIMKHSSEQAL